MYFSLLKHWISHLLLCIFRADMDTHESEVYMVAPEMPAMFDGMKLAAVATVLYIIVRCLNLKSPTAPPDLTYQDTALNRFLLKSCPILTKEWVPHFSLSSHCTYCVYWVNTSQNSSEQCFSNCFKGDHIFLFNLTRPVYTEVHLNKLEYRGKVHLFQ